MKEHISHIARSNPVILTHGCQPTAERQGRVGRLYLLTNQKSSRESRNQVRMKKHKHFWWRASSTSWNKEHPSAVGAEEHNLVSSKMKSQVLTNFRGHLQQIDGWIGRSISDQTPGTHPTPSQQATRIKITTAQQSTTEMRVLQGNQPKFCRSFVEKPSWAGSSCLDSHPPSQEMTPQQEKTHSNLMLLNLSALFRSRIVVSWQCWPRLGKKFLPISTPPFFF